MLRDISPVTKECSFQRWSYNKSGLVSL